MIILCQEDFKEQTENIDKIVILDRREIFKKKKTKSGYIVYCIRR